MKKLEQHEVSIDVNGVQIVGHYTLERRGKWDQLTVWYCGMSLMDSEIAHEAYPESTEWIAEDLLRQLAAKNCWANSSNP